MPGSLISITAIVVLVAVHAGKSINGVQSLLCELVVIAHMRRRAHLNLIGARGACTWGELRGKLRGDVLALLKKTHVFSAQFCASDGRKDRKQHARKIFRDATYSFTILKTCMQTSMQ
jgi:hypothetical protein